MRRGKKWAISDTALAEAIAKHNGNLTALAAKHGVSRRTVRRRLNESPELLELLDDERERTIDLVEARLLQLALGGDMKAIAFYLSAQAKHRGYGSPSALTEEGQREAVIHVVYGPRPTLPDQQPPAIEADYDMR